MEAADRSSALDDGGTDPDPLEQYKRYLRGLREAVERDPDMPLADVRAVLEHWGDHTGEPREVDYVEIKAEGVKALWATPRGCASDRVLVCSHGGGYSCGSMHSHRKLYGHIAKAVGCRALVLDFRRVPEHPYPAPLDDVVTVYRWLLDSGATPKHTALVGDSAGGALSITTILWARQAGLPLPAACVPLSPWVDLEATGHGYDENEDNDAVNSRALVIAMGEVVAPTPGARRDPLVAPLHADLRGLPPMYVQVGGHETFVGDARRLAARAREAGVEVHLDVFDRMQHCFQVLAGRTSQADDAVTRIGAWLRPRLGLV